MEQRFLKTLRPLSLLFKEIPNTQTLSLFNILINHATFPVVLETAVVIIVAVAYGDDDFNSR